MRKIWHVGLAVPDLERGMSDEFTGERVRLGKLGYPPFLTHGTDLLLNVGPGNILVEPCDLNIDRPHLRDLMPADSPFAGKPEFPAST
jgi:hypothetical protein